MERHHPLYGRGEHAISDSEEAEALGAHALADRLEAVFSAPDYKPPVLPAVAIELLELSRRPDLPLRLVVELLERDAILAAGVLRLAQSPAYAMRVPPRTLDDVVTRLGIRAVRDVVWEVAAGRVFRVPAYQEAMESLRVHSIATARIARTVAGYTALPSDQAFLCGLLHDVGFVASLIVLAEGPRGRRPRLAEVAGELESAHERAGKRVAELWQLPLDVQLVVGHHHVPRVEGHPHPLACIVAVAHSVVATYGRHVDLGAGDETDVVEAHAVTYATQALGLTPPQLEAIDAEAARLCSACSFAA